MISKAKKSTAEKGSDTRVWAVDDGKNAPYTNESTKKVTSPVCQAWKLQVRYSSRGMSGNATAFEIRVFLRSLFRSAEKEIVPGCNA